MKTRTRILLALGAVAGLAAIGWAFAPRPVEVEAAVVSRGPFEQAIEEDGRTRLRERYTISAPVAARLARIGLREGDAVRAGDVVAVLSPVMSAMVDERATREATSRVQAADAAIAGAHARAERSRVAEEEARLELTRTQRLTSEGYLSPARLDSARLALDGARRELEAARAAQAVAAHERAQAAALLQAPGASARGSPLPLRSPVDGEVLRVPLQSESTVAPGAVLLEIGDRARMEVVAELLTTDAVRAQPGTRAVIERWGGPAVEGRVRRVEPAAFTKVSALGIEEQRVNVVIDIAAAPDAWRSVGDGFRVTVRVITASTADAVLVPVGALIPGEDGTTAVYLVAGSRAVLRPVELAGRNAASAWIRSGLRPGDQVVVYPPPGVAAGRRITVRGRA